MPNNLHKKLNRIQHLIVKSEKSEKPERDLPQRYLQLADYLKGKIVSNYAGSYCLVKTFYPFEYCHGNMVLRDIIDNHSLPLSAFTVKNETESLELSSMLFIDIETTGLGGVGVVPFLIGCGLLVKNGFEIHQYLLPDYSDEGSMLEDLLKQLSPDKTIVSYNGATFDLPIIQDRMIINRVANELNYQHHVDLLHSARRLFRRRLKDCSLTNIEKNLFKFERTDDIPGYLVPSIYFEWLNQDSLEFMPSVMEHNRLDIVSLLFLICHIAKIYQSEGKTLNEVDDLYSLSRVYHRRKELNQVKNVYERISEYESEPLADDIRLFHSLNFKRIKAYEKALPLWESLSDTDSKEGYWANIELAKYYEHKEKDFQKAYSFAKKAEKFSPYGKYQQTQLTRRITRLSIKIESIS